MNEGSRKPEVKLPLHDEAQARSKWRGGETLLKGDDDDLNLPASETDGARSSRDEDEGNDGRSGDGSAGNFPPPD